MTGEYTVTSFDGAELHVEETGPADAPLTVVLAHGWTLSSRSWLAQAEALAGGAAARAAIGTAVGAATGTKNDIRNDHAIRVLRYDQRGHGKSTRGDAWNDGTTGKWGRGPSIDQLARDLHAILEALAPTGPVILGGHSMGGMTIMALADQHPDLFGDRVRGVLLVDTSAGGLHRLSFGFPQWAAAPVRIGLIRAMRRMAEHPGGADRVRGRQRTDSRFAIAQTKWLLFGKDAPRQAVIDCNQIVHDCPSATLGGFFPALLAHDKHAALPELGRVPVQVIVGSRDRLTPISHSKRLAAVILGAELIIVPGAGHMLLMENPEPVTALLTVLIDDALEDALEKPEKPEKIGA